ncbi:MAG: ABC transporter permease [Vicinamibacteraceae bacterium]
MALDEVRQAWRRMRSRPGMIGAAVGMLGLGIGLTTAMFTVADSLLLRPVPFRDAERLAWVNLETETGGRYAVSPTVLEAWRSSPAFESVEGASPGRALIEANGGLLSITSARVSPGLFDMLGVEPIRGRLFSARDGRAGSSDRVLLSEDLWRTTFSSDPQLVGSRIEVDGRSMVVAGILPAGFRFPDWDTRVWMPLDYRAPPPALAEALPIAYVRFASGVPRRDALRVATEAAHEADGSTREMLATPQALAGVELDEYYQRAMPLLAGGVALVLLALCANVCSLLLAQMTTRRHELGVCTALGASRGRLLRQALLESSVLGVLGAVAGFGLAWAFVSVARGFLPEAFLIRTLNPVAIDVRSLVVASATGVIATLTAGLLPAWLGTRLAPAESIRVIDRGGTETRSARHATRLLLVTEVALACMLLVGATLLVRSFINLARTDRGLNTHGVLGASVQLPQKEFADRASRLVAASALDEAVRSLPGVHQVAFTYGKPPGGGAVHLGEGWSSDVLGASSLDMNVDSYAVGPAFFDLYGIRLLRGRTFQPGELRNNVIVGEQLAAKLWPGTDPIGRWFAFDDQRRHVIGTASEIFVPSLDPFVDRPEFYEPFEIGGDYISINIRCGSACPPVALVRQRLLAASPGAYIGDIGPVEDEYVEQLARPRATAALSFAFAGIALIAAAGGLFGVLSYAVGRRRREFGIRTALGASPLQIRRLVLSDGVTVALAGVGIGVVAAWGLARALAALQYGVTPGDPWSWALVTSILAATTLLACWRPAHQAARVDPVTLLREE